MTEDAGLYTKVITGLEKPEKRIILKGDKLKQLYMDVYIRDNGECVYCHEWVSPGTPPHHKIFRSQGGSDIMDNLETVCLKCHYNIHHNNGK